MDEALDRYFELMHQQPQLFGRRARRKLILVRKDLEHWSKKHDVRLGVLAETPFFLFLQDLVTFDDGDPHPYSRLIAKKSLGGQNSVVVLPILRSSAGQKVVLVFQERHALGRQMLELPRGFAEPGVDESTQAANELAAETGCVGTPVFLGSSFTDTGSTDNRVSFYLVEVSERGDPKPEVTERIDDIVEMPLDAVREGLGTEEIADGYTVQAVALYDRFLKCGPPTLRD